MGTWTATTFLPKVSASESSTLSKSTSSLPILLTKNAVGRLISASLSKIFSVWTCTPSWAETTIRPVSTARSATCVSQTKLAKPGVSSRLILTLSRMA